MGSTFHYSLKPSVVIESVPQTLKVLPQARNLSRPRLSRDIARLALRRHSRLPGTRRRGIRCEKA
jgi:hypothetical protein